MAIKPLRHALRCLSDSETRGALLTLIDGQRQLLQTIRARLTPPLDAHCLYATLEEGKLTLVTDSPAWASRLRFQAPELTANLGSIQGEIAACQVRVQPLAVARRAPDVARPRARISPATASLLRQAGEAQGDTELGRALCRLAQAGAGDI
jgi:hypothetical protein